MPRSLSIFLPCYNEETSLEPVVLAALEAAARVSDDYEVIAIDDGSLDRTPAIADRLAAEHEAVRVVHHPTNQGYGMALRSGFAACTKTWVFYTDGDGQFDLDELVKVPPLLERFDVISGVRTPRRDNRYRRLCGWLWTRLVRAVFGLRVDDTDCAFKCYPRRLFEQIAVTAPLRSRGAMIDAEVLVKADRLGYRIGQLPVRHLPRENGRSTGGRARVILRTWVEMAGVWWQPRRLATGRAAGRSRLARRRSHRLIGS